MSTTALTGSQNKFPKLPFVICDDPKNGGIAGTPKKLPFVICDDPKNGGIAGTPKKLPFVVCEEKPKVFDWETGEWKYKDEFLKDNPFICYLA